MTDLELKDGDKCDCCDGTHPVHREWCYITESWIVNKSVYDALIANCDAQREHIEWRNDFIRRLMAELRQHG